MNPSDHLPQDLQVLVIRCCSNRSVVLVLADDRYLVGERIEFQPLHQHIPAHRHNVNPILADDVPGEDHDVSFEDLDPGLAVTLHLGGDEATLVQASCHAFDHSDVTDVVGWLNVVFSISRAQLLRSDRNEHGWFFPIIGNGLAIWKLRGWVCFPNEASIGNVRCPMELLIFDVVLKYEYAYS